MTPNERDREVAKAVLGYQYVSRSGNLMRFAKMPGPDGEVALYRQEIREAVIREVIELVGYRGCVCTPLDRCSCAEERREEILALLDDSEETE